jgi:hypothetical protein
MVPCGFYWLPFSFVFDVATLGVGFKKSYPLASPGSQYYRGSHRGELGDRGDIDDCGDLGNLCGKGYRGDLGVVGYQGNLCDLDDLRERDYCGKLGNISNVAT